MRYPENISLCVLTDKGAKGKWIKYYDINAHHFVFRKSQKDHEQEARRADAILLRDMAYEYRIMVHTCKFIGVNDVNSSIAFCLMHDCIKALYQDQSTSKDFQLFSPFSPQLISHAANMILGCLNVIGHSKIEKVPDGAKLLCSQLGKVAAEAVSRYEVVMYNDIKE